MCINQSDDLDSILHDKSDAVDLDNMSQKCVKLLLPFLLPCIISDNTLKRRKFFRFLGQTRTIGICQFYLSFEKSLKALCPHRFNVS